MGQRRVRVQAALRRGQQHVGDRDQRRVPGQPQRPRHRPLPRLRQLLKLPGHQGDVQRGKQHSSLMAHIHASSTEQVQPLPQRVLRRAVVRHPDLGGRPQPLDAVGGVRRRVRERRIRVRAAGQAGIGQRGAGQQAARELALVQARRLQPPRHQQHQLALINRKIMLGAGGQHLPDEPLDPRPVNRAPQQPQPRRQRVGELIPVRELPRPDRAQEQRVQRVQLREPLRLIPLRLRHAQRREPERVGTRQADLARRVPPDQARDSGLRPAPRVIVLAAAISPAVAYRRGALFSQPWRRRRAALPTGRSSHWTPETTEITGSRMRSCTPASPGTADKVTSRPPADAVLIRSTIWP